MNRRRPKRNCARESRLLESAPISRQHSHKCEQFLIFMRFCTFALGASRVGRLERPKALCPNRFDLLACGAIWAAARYARLQDLQRLQRLQHLQDPQRLQHLDTAAKLARSAQAQAQHATADRRPTKCSTCSGSCVRPTGSCASAATHSQPGPKSAIH